MLGTRSRTVRRTPGPAAGDPPGWARFLDALGLPAGRASFWQYAVAYTWPAEDQHGAPLASCVSLDTCDVAIARRKVKRIRREQQREGLPQDARLVHRPVIMAVGQWRAGTP